MKIQIAVPSFDERSVFGAVFKALWYLEDGGHELHLDLVSGYDVATARNKMVQNALDAERDFVLMVDSDTVLPQDALIQMLDDPVDVCLGFYAHRGNDNLYSGRTNICKLYDENGIKYFNYPLESEYTAEEMRALRESGMYKVVVHGGGMGCALIRTDVFRRLRYPWYDWVNYADDNRGMLSEDLFFCELCRKAKIPIYTDTRVGCGHILRHCQWPE